MANDECKMDNISNDVLEVTPEEFIKLRECYDMSDVKKTQENILTIRNWIMKEAHLIEASKYMNDIFIERMLYLAKGSLEASKIRIDKLLTTKTLMPELCLNRSIDEFDLLDNKIQSIVLPRLNPKDLSRVSFLRFLTDDIYDVAPLTVFRYIFMVEDYIQNHELNSGMTIVIDLKNFPLGYFLKLNPLLIKKSETLYTKGYNSRIKGINLLNAPYFINKILIFIKQIVSEKIAGRVYVHETYEDLYKYVSKEIVPKEYGGDGPQSADISEKWKHIFNSEEGRKTVGISEKLVADETKRCSSQFNEEYLGIPGSFRVLNVD